MAEPDWSSRARQRLDGRDVVLVGIGPAQLLGFAAAGARVAGVVSVVPAGGPPPPPETDAAPPLLTLEGTSRDILDHVVRRYAETLAADADRLSDFLDRIDPARTAAVASYLPLPHHVLGGRACWTADAGVSAALETKVAGGGPLAGIAAVHTIPSIPRPPGAPTAWWRDTCDALGTDRLVVQVAGLTGGGTGTYVCASAAEVPPLVPAIVSPFVEGRSGNVMGVVDDAGTTVVLPASRQLLRVDGGRPLYAGNVTGEPWAADARAAIASEVRSIGKALAAEGFFGPFGIDFIDTADGRRYHDLNPRMNGVVDSLCHLVDRDGQVPLVPALLSRPQWTPDEVASIEDHLHDAATTRPLARLWLTRTANTASTITTPPAAGVWRISATDPPAATFLGHDRRPGDAGDVIEGGNDENGVAGEVHGDLAVLQPLIPAGLAVEPGDRLAVGNLFCDPVLAEALDPRSTPALVDAFLA